LGKWGGNVKRRREKRWGGNEWRGGCRGLTQSGSVYGLLDDSMDGWETNRNNKGGREKEGKTPTPTTGYCREKKNGRQNLPCGPPKPKESIRRGKPKSRGATKRLENKKSRRRPRSTSSCLETQPPRLTQRGGDTTSHEVLKETTKRKQGTPDRGFSAFSLAQGGGALA